MTQKRANRSLFFLLLRSLKSTSVLKRLLVLSSIFIISFNWIASLQHIQKHQNQQQQHYETKFEEEGGVINRGMNNKNNTGTANNNPRNNTRVGISHHPLVQSTTNTSTININRQSSAAGSFSSSSVRHQELQEQQQQQQDGDGQEKADDDEDALLVGLQNNTTTTTTTTTNRHYNSSNIFSACLLVKDDNDILNEWIAYHYHTLNLRHLIVAIDPTSQTSPISIFRTWENAFDDLFIEIWKDKDFMPRWFKIEDGDEDYDENEGILGSIQNQDGQQEQREQQQEEQQQRPKHIGPRIKRRQQRRRREEQMLQLLDPEVRVQKKLNRRWEDSDAERTWNINVANSTVDELQRVYNHRFRQMEFLKQCMKHLKKDYKRHWTMHIDTDEYVVVNPLLLQQQQETQQQQIAVTNDSSTHGSTASSVGNFSDVLLPIPPVLSKGSLLTILRSAQNNSIAFPINYPCVSLPRVLYGSYEDPTTTSTPTTSNDNIWDTTRFETLRWKYHAPLVKDGSKNVGDGDGDGNINDTNDDASSINNINGKPKTMIDLSGIKPRDKLKMWDKIFSIHRPNVAICRDHHIVDFVPSNSYPLSLNHYLGSWERFHSRSNDPRRTWKTYQTKSNVAATYGTNIEEQLFMSSWLNEFIHEHGIEKVTKVLNTYRIKG